MTTRATELSVVVLGAEHNPTILNPNFLEAQEIVLSRWGWDVREDDPPLTTPPLSRVSYSSGVLITVQRERLQVTDNLLKNDVQTSKATEIAKRYVGKLPHVRYLATGLNFTAVVETNDPEYFLRDRFLKEGPWYSSPFKLSEVALRFGYPIENGRVRLNLDVGSIEVQEEGAIVQRPVIIAKANFHRDCQPHSSAQVERNLDFIAQDWDIFKVLIKENLEGEL